ncbi:MAG: glycosyltransferase [Muribaculaceae bacterium]|nr:glycosyltransferase [Muribaculaceae bacterium]
MINLFFFDEYNSSIQNGIGTYRDILLPALGEINSLSVTLISLNSFTSKDSESERSFGHEIALPYIHDGDWRGHGAEICDMLKKYITDSPCNIFMLNHSPAADFIKNLKENYPKSKLIFTVHDQGWCAALLGSRSLLEEIILKDKRPEKVSENTFNNIKIYHKSELDIYNLVDKVISISPFMDNVMKDIYQISTDKRVMIYNGFTPFKTKKIRQATARRLLGFGADEELLIFAGRPVRHKGVAPLIMAVSELRRTRPNLRCIMCGNMQTFANYDNLIRPQASAFVFTGQVPRDELPLWYAAADVGVMPSYSEPFGYSAIEMADRGLPIVVSDGSALGDIYHDNENAFVAPIGTDVTKRALYAQSIKEAITRALDSSSYIRRRLYRKNKEYINTRYSAAAMCDSYLGVFQSLM